MTTTQTRNGAPKQTSLARRPEEAGMSLVRPLVWLSRIFPDTKIAVSVADVQVLFRGKHGPPSTEEAQRFLFYCAGYGVDPRVGQAYLIPFEEEYDGKKYVKWQKGLAYEVFMNFAASTGTVLGHHFEPDPSEWPETFDPKFYVKIVIERTPPLLPVVYGSRLGPLAQRFGGKLTRAWADGKVGWEHMTQVAFERRGYRLATGLSRAYGKEEFGRSEDAPDDPQMPEGFEDAIIVPEASEVQQRLAEEVEAAPAPPAPDTPAPAATPSNLWADEEEEATVPAEAPAEVEPAQKTPQEQAEGFVSKLTDAEVDLAEEVPYTSASGQPRKKKVHHGAFVEELERACGDAGRAKAWLEKKFATSNLKNITIAQMREVLPELLLAGDGSLQAEQE